MYYRSSSCLYHYGFLRFVLWPNSGHFWGVYQSQYFSSECAFLFSFVYVMYLNIASYLYEKQIKSKLGNKLYSWMIFICVYLNLPECSSMTLNISNQIFLRYTEHHRRNHIMCFLDLFTMRKLMKIIILFLCHWDVSDSILAILSIIPTTIFLDNGQSRG